MPPQFSGEAPELYVRAIAAMKDTFNPTGELDKAGAEAVRDVLAQSQPEIKQADVDVAKTYTNKFLKR
jgi:NitT/TauT family transport system substrate-binding protein